MTLPGFVSSQKYLKSKNSDSYTGFEFLKYSTQIYMNMSLRRWRCINDTREACIEAGFEQYGGLDCNRVAYEQCT
jgi:hypothetical protein